MLLQLISLESYALTTYFPGKLCSYNLFQLKTALQAITLIEHTDPNKEPNVRKQETAFPPNFIHSLDSSHMMLTANACQRTG